MLTSTGSPARDTVLEVDRVLMSTDDDGLGALARDGSNDTGLSP